MKKLALQFGILERVCTFEVLNYLSSGESCPDIDRGFFVAFLFQNDTRNTVVASFPNGLNTIALDRVEHGLRTATVFFCAVQNNKRSILSCSTHKTTQSNSLMSSCVKIQSHQLTKPGFGLEFRTHLKKKARRKKQ